MLPGGLDPQGHQSVGERYSRPRLGLGPIDTDNVAVYFNLRPTQPQRLAEAQTGVDGVIRQALRYPPLP